MKILSCSLLILGLISQSALAQRDGPVRSAYLSKISIENDVSTQLNVDLEFTVDGGPKGNSHRQMYLVAFLKKDEKRVSELVNDETMLDKTSEDKLFLQNLVEEKIAFTLNTQVSKRQAAKFAPDEFKFDFNIENKKLLELASIQLINFYDTNSVLNSGNTYFNDRIKLLVFVPVNDSRLADQIKNHQKSTFDFAKYRSDLDDGKELFYLKNACLYSKILPYSFQVKKFKNGSVALFIE